MKIVYLLQVMGFESLPYNKSGLWKVNFTRRSLRRYTVVVVSLLSTRCSLWGDDVRYAGWVINLRMNCMRPTALAFFIVLLGLLHASLAVAQSAVQAISNGVLQQVIEIERDLDARVGLFLHDIDSGELVTHAADDRFPLNSTFKLFACAALMARVEAGVSALNTQVKIDEQELVPWSPSLERMLEAGRKHASFDELCAAMLSVSDNSAANLILREIGGPQGFTRYMRSIGDTVTRLDRWEPELNEGLPNDPRDTTTPAAIGRSLERILLGQALAPSSREKLEHWLSGHLVAGDLFRSALPESWSIHDRTGAGNNGTRGIVAVIYRANQGPLVATMYMRDANVSLAIRDAAIARVGSAIFTQFGED